MEHEIGPHEPYAVTNLNRHEKLIDKIQQLESQMREELGEEITLISYTKNAHADLPACRAGLDN
ncbi:hypothetical protein SY83_07830 [Paenibacillus swuensis]|uniref:Uncharacterized protein n=1 Tax=Paenibacillus swuensis TaxID=1178515 RepID=A0A172TGL1_9BACL|nr:hypothetical protein [Paenibacillus swuensis]ANE46195.1 hypothetical protein SY83_07830 [Paenibacillus swuensis]